MDTGWESVSAFSHIFNFVAHQLVGYDQAICANDRVFSHVRHLGIPLSTNRTARSFN